jgi:hypothetical protein
MKINFKVILSVAFFFATLPSFAQVSIGAQGGVTMANPTIEAPSGLNYESKSRIGLQAGLMFDIPLGEGGLRVMPEIKYANKVHGFNVANVTLPGVGTFNYSGKANVSYIEVPVNLAYAFGGDTKFIIGAGPYAGYGLNGKSEVTVASGSTVIQTTTEDVSFGTGNAEIKRLDFGANAMAGVLLNNGLMLKVNYGLGLTNLYAAGGTYKNKYLGATVVYFFRK